MCSWCGVERPRTARSPSWLLRVLGPSRGPAQTYAVGGIKGVKAATVAASEQVTALHAELVQEWSNESHWPKHLLVQYRWHEDADVDATAGVYVLLGFGAPRCAELLPPLPAFPQRRRRSPGLSGARAAGTLVASVSLASALLAHEARLTHFFREIVDEGPAPSDSLASPSAGGFAAILPCGPLLTPLMGSPVTVKHD